MSLLNKQQLKYAMNLCFDRDGNNLCHACGEGPKDGLTIRLHHRDNNPHNNPIDGSNWELRCVKCNNKADPRGPSKYPKHRKDIYFQDYSQRIGERGKPRPRYMEMAKNEKGEKIFRAYAMTVCSGTEAVTDLELINAGAEECTKQGCSLTQQTIKRYLDKMVNRINGCLELHEEGEETFVKLRPKQ